MNRSPRTRNRSGADRSLAAASLLAGLLLAAVVCAEPVRLHSVEVSGGPLSRAEILQAAELEEGIAYEPEHFASARDSLEVRLRWWRGHPFARVSRWELRWAPDSARVELLAEVEPGPVAVVDSVALSGPVGPLGGELRGVIRTRPGQVFDPRTWRGDLERVLALLEARGRPFARVQTRPLVPRFGPDTVAVSLGMEVVPGVAVRLERLEIAGLARTDPELARRAAGVAVGDVYDGRLVERGRRRLRATGWFAEVSEPRLFRDSEGRYGLVYRVEEREAGVISGALGYAPVEGGEGGLAGSLDLRLRNFFGGGRDVELGWSRQPGDRRWVRAGYRQPWVFGAPVDLAASFEQEVEDTLYTALRAKAGVAWRPGENWRMEADAGWRDVTADRFSPGSDNTGYRGLLLAAGAALDTRDDPANPSRGGRVAVRVERLQARGGAAFEVLDRSTLAAEHLTQLPWPGWVGYGRLGAEEVRATGGSPPYAEWVRLGGLSTLRGFTDRLLASPRAAWGSLEVRRLLGGRTRAFLFVDEAVREVAGQDRWHSAWGVGAQVEAGPGELLVAVGVPFSGGFGAAVVHAGLAATF